MVDKKLLDHIQNLDDKQACFIVEKLTGEIYSNMLNAPGFREIAQDIDKTTLAAGNPLNLQNKEKWQDQQLSLEDSGPVARSILEAMASEEELEPLVKLATEEFVDTTLDLGILTLGAAISLIFIVISSDIELNINWKSGKFSLKKRGLSPKAQERIIKKFTFLGKLPFFKSG